MTSWTLSMLAAGACSAWAILLIRDIPKFAGGIPAALTVGIYMLIGGISLLLVAANQIEMKSVQWPSFKGFAAVATIGVLLALLELFFVDAAQQAMPIPDAVVVYNVTSLTLLAIVELVFLGESMNLTRLGGLGLGIASMILLLQPVNP